MSIEQLNKNQKTLLATQNAFEEQHGALANPVPEKNFEEGESPSLGINTKSSAKYLPDYIQNDDKLITTRVNPNTQEQEIVFSQEDQKFLKFQRLTIAREILYDKQKADNYKATRHATDKITRFDIEKNRNVSHFKNVNKQHRTFHCYHDLKTIATHKGSKATIDNEPSVSVYQKPDQNIYLKGQFVCSSVWTCPVCSSKITESRKNDIQKAFEIHRKNGGAIYEQQENKQKTIKETTNGIYLFTLTLPHYLKDDLTDLMSKIRIAISKFKAHRTYKETLKSFNYMGEIRALEVTWGKTNGWHPHFHSIFFFKQLISKKDLLKIKSKLLPIWQQACLSAGLQKPNEKHGIDLQDGSQAQNYVNKWGIEHEVSKWTSKRGQKTSMTPFQLLDSYNTAEDQEEKNFYRKLFNEYAKAFYGFRQLYWSPKLKDFFGINDKTDEQLAEEEIKEEDIFLASINLNDWKLLRRHSKNHKITNTNLPLIFHIPKLVKKYGIQELFNLIYHLRSIEQPDYLKESEEALKVFYPKLDI